MTNNISKDAGKVHNCSGCQMCAAVCPNHAICIVLDEEGFYNPQINHELCSHCGLCVKSCYKYDDSVQMTTDEYDIEVYAAFTKDSKILLLSTSGGISSHLVNACLEQGYKVIGVAYNYEENIAVSEIANNFREAKKFRGSKYMQAYTEKALKLIVEGDKNQKYAVFGTPCQIYALNKWAVNKGRREQFLFVDLFCHGCPSINLWKKYLDYIKEKTKVSEFEKIEFRSKAQGWHEYCHCFYMGDIQVTSVKTIDDPFFTLFFDNEILGYSCYDCLLRSTMEYTDIRLGDFWGHEYDLNTQGVSAVVACTLRGKELFETIKPLIIAKEATLDSVVKFQSYGKNYTYNSEMRSKTMELLKSEKNMHTIFKEYLKAYSLKKQVYRKSKKVLYALPKVVRDRIKKVYHGLLNFLKENNINTILTL